MSLEMRPMTQNGSCRGLPVVRPALSVAKRLLSQILREACPRQQRLSKYLIEESSRPAEEDGWNYACAKAEQRDAGRHTDYQQWPFESSVQTCGPKHVIRKEHRQVDDDADYGGGYGC